MMFNSISLGIHSTIFLRRFIRKSLEILKSNDLYLNKPTICRIGGLMLYWVNDFSNNSGVHEVHRHDCPWGRKVQYKTPIGAHLNAELALIEAKNYYKNVIACNHCCFKSEKNEF